MDSDTYHELYDGAGHCRECGALVGLGGPDFETYGYATIHTAWHADTRRPMTNANGSPVPIGNLIRQAAARYAAMTPDERERSDQEARDFILSWGPRGQELLDLIEAGPQPTERTAP